MKTSNYVTRIDLWCLEYKETHVTQGITLNYNLIMAFFERLIMSSRLIIFQIRD